MFKKNKTSFAKDDSRAGGEVLSEKENMLIKRLQFGASPCLILPKKRPSFEGQQVKKKRRKSSEDYAKMTLIKLRQIAKSKGLNTKGSKKVLIQRLEAAGKT